MSNPTVPTVCTLYREPRQLVLSLSPLCVQGTQTMSGNMFSSIQSLISLLVSCISWSEVGTRAVWAFYGPLTRYHEFRAIANFTVPALFPKPLPHSSA